jgi:predicted TIM-barrel fold metal-dependent hydrolase
VTVSRTALPSEPSVERSAGRAAELNQVSARSSKKASNRSSERDRVNQQPPGPIWDVHCHLSGVPGRTPEERMSALIQFADRMGIQRMCVFMGLSWTHDPSPADLVRQNDEVLQALAHWHDRAFGFVYVSPKHVEVSLRELDRCLRDGPMVGVKLWVAARCGDEQIDPIIRRATELKAPILQHTWHKTTGNLPGESAPDDLARLARRHPQAALICGHTGGNWEWGIRAVRSSPNVSVDLGGFDPTSGAVEMAVRELGPARVLYGSDAGGRSFASQLGKVLSAEIPTAARQAVLGGNLRRLLQPVLESKGISPR